jgi:UDP-2,4-diacetamido-2,4,6-trideoxy-beta-L-altropyranose hydrolase
MRIVIRADASIQIGTGHVMRCLTLAEALRDSGANVAFITRAHPGNMNEHINSKGFNVHTLPDLCTSEPQQNLDGYTQWLGVDQVTDAEEIIQVLADKLLDWLIVDHYALDKNWEEKLRPHAHKIMVIDDLADRLHTCDLLLDQNLGRQASDYSQLVPEHCTVLAGPQYALLRPEFAALREYSLKRRETPVIKHILITMGGADQPDATGLVLDALKSCPLTEDCTITVVMGSHAPWLEKVHKVAQQMPWKTEVKVNINNMAQVMADSDLAIGAAGSTTWELSCLGLPSLLVVLAENQRSIAEALDANGAAISLGDISEKYFSKSLGIAIKQLIGDAGILLTISATAADIVDGRGADKLTSLMRSH